MAKVREEKPQSLPEYLQLIESLQQKAAHSLWYRGCERSCYQLIPSLYRHRSAATPESLAELERQPMTRFRQRSISYHTRSLSEDWDALFFMQHYGVPTRLLDWTENPLTGLHFALIRAPHTVSATGNIKFKESATLWMLVEKFFMLPPARIHGSCHRLQEKLRGKLRGKASNEKARSNFLSEKWCPRRDSNARPSA